MKSINSINIWYGSDENADLSNLAERPFRDRSGNTHLSVEQAYQSWKSGAFDPETHEKAWAPGKKILGRKGTKTQGNWNLILMRDLVGHSFQQNPQALQALLDTGEAPLTHLQDRGIWRTEFPKILMELRSEFANARKPGYPSPSQSLAEV